MSVIVELSIFPLDKGTSLSPYVARALDVIRASGLPHELNPMGTCIEGPWDEVMDAVGRCIKALEPDCDRIYLNIKADWKRGTQPRMQSKTASVREKTEKA